LALPPDFQLRPPEPGAPRPQEGTAQQQAQIAVFRAAPSSAPTPGADLGADLTPGEQALLLSAGADRTEPNIRQLINQETSEINAADETFISKLIFWQEPEPPGVIVDPDAEARRLRENAALGREATAGQTPIIERKARLDPPKPGHCGPATGERAQAPPPGWARRPVSEATPG
jgi:hypothetical protein